MNPEAFCAMLCEELNVRKLTFPLPLAADGQQLAVAYDPGEGFDLMLGWAPTGRRELARRLFVKAVLPGLAKGVKRHVGIPS